MSKAEIITREGRFVDYLSISSGDTMPACDNGNVTYHEYGTQLRKSNSGEYVLDVLCGRVGQYSVEFSLNQEEINNYISKGDQYIHDLGIEVTDNPELYSSREHIN